MAIALCIVRWTFWLLQRQLSGGILPARHVITSFLRIWFEFESLLIIRLGQSVQATSCSVRKCFVSTCLALLQDGPVISTKPASHMHDHYDSPRYSHQRCHIRDPDHLTVRRSYSRYRCCSGLAPRHSPRALSISSLNRSRTANSFMRSLISTDPDRIVLCLEPTAGCCWGE